LGIVASFVILAERSRRQMALLVFPFPIRVQRCAKLETDLTRKHQKRANSLLGISGFPTPDLGDPLSATRRRFARFRAFSR
jgi:hypothetical protein